MVLQYWLNEYLFASEIVTSEYLTQRNICYNKLYRAESGGVFLWYWWIPICVNVVTSAL